MSFNPTRRQVLAGLAASFYLTEATAMTRTRTETNHLVVHGAYTPTTMDIGALEIDRWHRERGFLQIGYHTVIRRDGTIETGRSDALIGAGVYGFNSDSFHICLVGGKAEEGGWEANYTGLQYDALREHLRTLHYRYPNAEVLGHTDFPRVTKKCPAFDVREWYR